ncbi:MAG: [protein-PII] uridylyltransferase [Ignavibacteriales bacterium]|nr:[protein-PII] uridylyltransferase [Ignavibacteriales bacterium]
MAVSTPGKQVLAHQFQSIVKLHRQGAGGLRIALALTRRLDGLITSVFRSLKNPEKKHIAVVALGGYGRKELCFSSDVDIMFLIRDESQKPATAASAGDLLHALLEYGLDIGHSFRTIQECVDSSSSDIEIWHSLLEARFICGNRSVFSSLHLGLQRQIRFVDSPRYTQNLIIATELRHRKYGHSTKLLEPNVKNSAGGLRDLHTVLWLGRGTGLSRLTARPAVTHTALTEMLRGQFLGKLFDIRFLKDAKRGLDFLLRTRNEMHLNAQALHDTLEFNLQRQVAKALKYRDSSTQTNVERFMKDYYVAARVVSQLAGRIMSWAHDRFVAETEQKVTLRLAPPFVIKDAKLDLGSQATKLSSGAALRAFLLSIDHAIPLSYRLEDVLTRSAKRHTPLQSEQETSLFRELLNRPHGVGHALQRMNDFGLLQRWIPEWKGLVAFFQHNQYHFYTADEHTLIVLSNAEALSASPSAFGDIFRSLQRRDTLYLAALCHDIAKPIRIGDHEIIGVDIARTILKRLRYDDIMEDVLFLVRNHLLMEQIAFRRNLGDQQTIIDFTSKIEGTRQLDLLYLLTYADLSAVNKNVWTDWKAMLLQELYQRSHEILERNLTSDEYARAEADRRRTAVQDMVNELSSTIPEAEARSHLDAVESPAYLAAFDATEIAEHIRRIGADETVSTVFKKHEDHTEVTIIARDAPFALSRFCGVLSANDANILDAQIFTRNDGIIIDRFRVVDFISKSALSSRQCDKIHQELNHVFDDVADIESLLSRHKMKWKRRSRIANPNVRIDVEFENHPRFTIIDVYAPDMLGFLYRITGTMSMLGLNISFAKIATRIDGIVDSFYVLDLTGRKVDDEGQRSYVRSEILKVINDLSESELVMQ